jgi:signal transduction histidine kinase
MPMRRVRAIWHWWLTPTHSDADQAFRERTLRVALALMLLANGVQIVFILLDPDIKNSRAVVFLGYALCVLAAGALVGHGRLNSAGVLTTLAFMVSIAVSQTRQGYWSGFMFWELALGVIFGLLIFPRVYATLFGAMLVLEFTVIAFWQDRAAVPYHNPLRAGDALISPGYTAIGVAAFIFAIIGLHFYYDQEFHTRARQLKELVETLEERVAKRTAELQAANQQLKELAGIKDEFVSNVSHELRTPITNLKLHYYLLAQQPEKLHEHLGVIQRETERLSRIIESLLTLSRMDQGRISLERVELDLNMLAQQYVEDRAPVAQRQGQTLRAELQPDAPHVMGDSGLLGQALSILLTNALTYTPPGGTVVVKVGACAVDGMDWGELAVIDNGPGITPDEQVRLFERFFRGNAAHVLQVPGTGLGLAILKEIVSQHAGRVEVHSTGLPGEGTRFSILLPPAVGQTSGTAA